jgi:hypothetical protein
MESIKPVSENVKPPRKPLLSGNKAAEFLAISPRQLRILVRDGRGPTAVRLGECKFAFDIEDLERFIDENKSNAPIPPHKGWCGPARV